MPSITPVVLCGGSGTRLWPRSRATKPKPFIPLLGKTTLYQETLRRCSDRTIFTRPVVVVGEQHLEHAVPQAGSVAPDAQFIVEPVGRNTAPAIALAALTLDPDAIMLVCPSDHHILDTEAFKRAAQAAANLASDDWLVAFGILATAPETGYGYLHRGDRISEGFKIQSFVEKPDLPTAIGFLEDGSYAWNGGIFAFKAGRFLEELALHRPEMARDTEHAYKMGFKTDEAFRPEANSFAAIKGESVDYAVMENTRRAAMVDASMGWSDIGNWDALLHEREKDENGNVIMGPGEVIGASGSMIDSDGPHVTILGADNLVVVVDGNDVLVTARSAVQRVGEVSRCKKK